MNINPHANEELDGDTHDTSDDYCPHGQEWGECCDGLGIPMEDVGEVDSESNYAHATCIRCKGTGVIICWQDGMPGGDWCPVCDGNGMVAVRIASAQ